jgi:hypothetical protein
MTNATLKVVFLLLLLTVIPLNVFARERTISDVPRSQFSRQVNQDIRLLKSFTENIGKTAQAIEGSDLFKKGRTKDFDIGERENLYLLWGNYLDHMIAFESLISFYKDFYLITDREDHADAFLVAYAASLARHASSVKIIRQTIDNDLYEKILDDLNPDYGIPAGMYAKLKWNTIHVQDMTGVLAGYQYYRFLGKGLKKRGVIKSEENSWLFDSIQRNYDYIIGEMKHTGPQYFAANGLDIVKEKSFTAWFPIQMHLSDWMGDTKVKRVNKTLITLKQISDMEKHLRPGDIIVERRNWYLSNIGLPGFWPHAELFIGSYEDLRAFFSEPEVTNYYKREGAYNDFMDYMSKKYPEQIEHYRRQAHDGYPYQIIEAVSEGVKFSSLQEGASADYIGVLRPRLSKLDIAKAIDEAFRFIGRPYDFNFDFLTDSSIVCSELIYKIYKNGQGKKGLALSIRDIAGRKAMPANDIVDKFDREYDGQERELEFVYFLDGIEKEKKALIKRVSDFRASHRRMKWDIAQK